MRTERSSRPGPKNARKSPPPDRVPTPRCPAEPADRPPDAPSLAWIFDATLKKNREKIAPVLKVLAIAHPAVIPDSPEKLRPWATGLHEVLFQRHPEYSRTLIRSALEAVSRTKQYLQALAAGGPRYDVDGNVCGEVSAEQSGLAAQALRDLETGIAAPPPLPSPPQPAPAAKPVPRPPERPASVPDRITYRPIGVISTPWHAADMAPVQAVAARGVGGVITLDRRLVDGLLDLEGFSHVIVVYDFDRVREWKLRVTPELDDQEHGIFAARSAGRPNPIGISVLELVRIDPPHIYVKNVDMLNGTPILDIKPYVPEFDAWPATRIGWYDRES